MRQSVGIIGLGIIGSNFAKHLIAEGMQVIGYDTAPPARDRLAALGGEIASSPGDVADHCPVVLACLPSEAALDRVVSGPGGLTVANNRHFTLVECGTLSVEAKEAAYHQLQEHGAKMLDCPVSGTGVQAANRDVVFYASGDKETFRVVEPLLRLVGRDAFFLGAFGNGMRMKLLSNLLVSIHNVAAAEAIVLARRAGIDLEVMMQAVSAGAGTSRMFEIRGPMMISGDFHSGASSRLDVFQKDLDAISRFTEECGIPSPVFALCKTFYRKAIELGWTEADPGVVYRIVEQMSVQGQSGRK